MVFSVPAPETLTDSAHRQAIEATLTELRKLPQVVQVTDPFQAGTISQERADRLRGGGLPGRSSRT